MVGVLSFIFLPPEYAMMTGIKTGRQKSDSIDSCIHFDYIATALEELRVLYKEDLCKTPAGSCLHDH